MGFYLFSDFSLVTSSFLISHYIKDSQCKTGQDRRQNRTGERTGKDRTDQDRTGRDMGQRQKTGHRTGQERTGQDITGPGTEDQVKASVVSLLEKLRLFEMVDFVVLRHGHDIILNRQELGALHRDFYAKGGELALNLDSRLHNLESKFNDMMKVIV